MQAANKVIIQGYEKVCWLLFYIHYFVIYNSRCIGGIEGGKGSYEEASDLRNWLDKLEGQKTLQTLDSLAKLWKGSQDEALEIANRLFDVGFFEKRATQGGELIFRVPFLY